MNNIVFFGKPSEGIAATVKLDMDVVGQFRENSGTRDECEERQAGYC